MIEHSRATAQNSYLTLAAIAALAFITACVSHEAVGHGGTCLARGAHITLLSSVYFHCSDGGGIVDAMGPLMNLVVGTICWVLLRSWPARWENGRRFLVFAMAFNLFWGSGYFIHSAVTDSGDWAFVLRDLALQPVWLWRCLMGALGVFLYYCSLELVDRNLPRGTPTLLPYLVAGIVSCLAVLFFAGPTLPALIEAARESFGAGIGLLILAYRHSRRARPTSSTSVIPRSNGWLIASAVITLAFLFTLAGASSPPTPNERSPRVYFTVISVLTEFAMKQFSCAA